MIKPQARFFEPSLKRHRVSNCSRSSWRQRSWASLSKSVISWLWCIRCLFFLLPWACFSKSPHVDLEKLSSLGRMWHSHSSADHARGSSHVQLPSQSLREVHQVIRSRLRLPVKLVRGPPACSLGASAAAMRGAAEATGSERIFGTSSSWTRARVEGLLASKSAILSALRSARASAFDGTANRVRARSSTRESAPGG